MLLNLKKLKKQLPVRLEKLFNIKGSKPVDYFYKKLGHVMWDYVGMSRNAEGLKKAITMIQEIREEFWKDVKVTGEMNNLNPELEKAGRVADFFDIGELDGPRCTWTETNRVAAISAKNRLLKRVKQNVTTNCLLMFRAGSTKGKTKNRCCIKKI
jgi:hypothetical protein